MLRASFLATQLRPVEPLPGAAAETSEADTRANTATTVTAICMAVVSRMNRSYCEIYVASREGCDVSPRFVLLCIMEVRINAQDKESSRGSLIFPFYCITRPHGQCSCCCPTPGACMPWAKHRTVPGRLSRLKLRKLHLGLRTAIIRLRAYIFETAVYTFTDGPLWDREVGRS